MSLGREIGVLQVVADPFGEVVEAADDEFQSFRVDGFTLEFCQRRFIAGPTEASPRLPSLSHCSRLLAPFPTSGSALPILALP